MLSIVGIIDFGETKKSIFALPLHGCFLFDPVACDRKIAIGITSLPCIECNIYCTTNSITLYARLDQFKLGKGT